MIDLNVTDKISGRTQSILLSILIVLLIISFWFLNKSTALTKSGLDESMEIA